MGNGKGLDSRNVDSWMQTTSLCGRGLLNSWVDDWKHRNRLLWALDLTRVSFFLDCGHFDVCALVLQALFCCVNVNVY